MLEPRQWTVVCVDGRSESAPELAYPRSAPADP
jgi:hypothetical protein